MEKLKKVKCFLLDLDGTIYLGNKMINGAEDFLKSIKDNNKNYCFVTNNSSRSSKDYLKKLKNIGINANEKEVITSGFVAAKWIKENHKDKTVYLLGTKSLYKEFKDYGIKLTNKNPDIVLLSYDTELTYKKLCDVCFFINCGAKYYSTHPDINCPSEKGFLPDVGSFIALIEKSTNKLPEIIFGKPYGYIANTISKRFNIEKNEIAMVGDRLSTDIKFGIDNNFVSVLTLSGETNMDMLNKSNLKPDIIVDSVKDLIKFISI